MALLGRSMGGVVAIVRKSIPSILLCTGYYKMWLTLRFIFAYNVCMGEMRRALAREEAERIKGDRFASTPVIATSIIAAVRLAREDISRSSPRLTSVISDSVALATAILNQIVR